MASILDLLPKTNATLDSSGVKTEVKGGQNIVEFLMNLLFPNSNKEIPAWTPRPSQTTAPQVLGTTSPTMSPTMSPEPLQDPLKGFNTKRGLPPQEVRDLILNAAKEADVPPALIAAILFNESGFNPKAININSEGNIDRGIAQINTVAHPEITDSQAFDPSFAIPFLAKKLKGDREYFGNLGQAISAYNVGRGGASQNGPRGKMYLDKVLQNLEPDYAKSIGIQAPFQ